MSTIEDFKKTASLNSIEVRDFDEIKQELENIGYSGQEYFNNNNISVVRALAANSKEASAIVDVSDEEKLSCLIDAEKLIIIIEKDKIFSNMHGAYKEAYKSNQSNYMIFVSQESKTADIEKQLISGVQGAEKLVFVII